MASLHKQPGKPFWFCAYSTRDNQGRLQRRFRSTGTPDKKQAWQVCNVWAKAAALGSKLTPDKARHVIRAGVEDVLAVAGETLPSATIRDWAQRWLENKAVENEASTHSRYQLALDSFLTFLGPNAARDLAALNPDTILRFRDACSKNLSAGTTNTHLRVIRACLNAARRQGLIEGNVATQVSPLKERGETRRRALTLAETQRVLARCGDTPWRGLVLVGFYTGQRLGDCARLTWQQVDLAAETIWFVTQKTGKRLAMTLAKPLAEYLSCLPSVDDPNAAVFPRFAEMAHQSTGRLSDAFAMEVLIPAGLMAPRDPHKKSTGVGRTGKRQVNEITFHSLRHSFTTMLKATGASEALAQMIVGHDSPLISRHYTHLSAADTAAPIRKLPDVTK